MTITIGYARVSLNDDRQQLGLSIQLDALQHCDYVYKEKQSGYTDTREQFHKALSLACQLKQSGHEVTFVIYKLDRLTRKLTTLLQTLTIFEEYGIHLTSLQEQIDSQTLTGKFMCTLLGFVAEMELENIRARTKAGFDGFTYDSGWVIGEYSRSHESWIGESQSQRHHSRTPPS